jgi:hypothetical protein
MQVERSKETKRERKERKSSGRVRKGIGTKKMMVTRPTKPRLL